MQHIHGLRFNVLVSRIQSIAHCQRLDGEYPFGIRFREIIFQHGHCRNFAGVEFVSPLANRALVSHRRRHGLGCQHRIGELRHILALHISDHIVIIQGPYAIACLTKRFPLQGILGDDACMVLQAIGEDGNRLPSVMLNHVTRFIDIADRQHEIRLAGNRDPIGRPQRDLWLDAPHASVHGDGISRFAIDEFVLDDGTTSLGIVGFREGMGMHAPESFDELLFESTVEQFVRVDLRNGCHTTAFVGRVEDAREHRQRGLTGNKFQVLALSVCIQASVAPVAAVLCTFAMLHDFLCLGKHLEHRIRIGQLLKIASSSGHCVI